MDVYILGPRRYTNVFDESKINRIRWITMFWTEYNDSLAHSVNRMRERVNSTEYREPRFRESSLAAFRPQWLIYDSWTTMTNTT